MMKNCILAIAATILILGSSIVAVNAQSKKLWTYPKTGVWRVTAKDEENKIWNGRLTLNRKAGGKYRGYFYWIDAEKATSGREYFNGRFDRSTGKLRLRGYAVKNVKGELGTGNYRATVNRQGRNIYRGSWSGQNSIPGKWAAVWLRAK